MTHYRRYFKPSATATPNMTARTAFLNAMRTLSGDFFIAYSNEAIGEIARRVERHKLALTDAMVMGELVLSGVERQLA